MSNYSIWITEESNVSISGDVTLDGITQGDGSHLVGKTMTIGSSSSHEVRIRDSGSETNIADNDSSQRLDGDQVIDGVSYGNNTRIEAEYQFVLCDESTGEEYRALAINVVNSGRSYATNEGIAFVGKAPPAGVSLKVMSAAEGPRNSGANAVDASEIVPMCVCRGTRIRTARGTLPVEALREGDGITRTDGSIATLRRVFRAEFQRDALEANANLRPVRIASGALGRGLPERDLLVSRHHRMLVVSKIAQRMFGTFEVLVPACKLTALPGISVDEAVEAVEYYHLLFDRHELVFAEGAPTESLFTGPEMQKSVSPEALAEIKTLFPEMSESFRSPQPVRYIPPAAKQKVLAERHGKNAQALLQFD